ncbi:MAG: redoxin domain-containing protein [Planctomycetes bacterium]|nr:redoxin domain-containing protein [Planctomycetota bacterium]
MRDDKAKFDVLNTVILGVNNAKENSHKNYCEKFGFNFDLLCDIELKLSEKLGAIKNNGVERTVVVVDKNFVIKYYKKGMPANDDIINAIKAF